MHARAAAIPALAAVSALAGATPAAAPEPAPPARILAFTKTAGFRHDSISAALRAVRELGADAGLAVDATEDARAFSDASLARYAAVVFLLTTGDVLDDGQQAAFERFVRAGGGFVGVHSAADTEYEWPWYGGLVGTYFTNHPQIQRAVVEVADARHPSTVGLPRRWTRTDEWYNFAAPLRGAIRILATLDETSYSPGEGAMGAEHPIAWSHEYEGGRAWYTGGGHTDESYSEPLFRRHLLGGIRYAAGLTPPRIDSVTTTVRARRLLVSVRYSSCRPCAGELRVRVDGRWSSTPLRLRSGTGSASSPRLPQGRWQLAVVLEDRATGLSRTVRRWVRVP
jgi:cytochrome c